jgi:cytochrome c-type biogenesis protein
MSGFAGLVSSGPLLLAIPVAAAAGALTFLSPCVLPLVPGYLSYITGMSGAAVASDMDARAESAGAVAGAEPAGAVAGAAEASGATATSGASGSPVTAIAARAPARVRRPGRPSRRRAVTGTLLFVLGFSTLYASYGLAFGQIGSVLYAHRQVLAQVLGTMLIVLGLMFAGVFDRFSFAGRIVKPSVRPRVGLASAPVLGVLFGLGWTPCIGPTLSAVLLLGLATGTAARGALLAFVYGLGIGIPFLLVAFAVERGVAIFGFARRHARVISRIGGALLIVVGLLEVTGAWGAAMLWLQSHRSANYVPPI